MKPDAALIGIDWAKGESYTVYVKATRSTAYNAAHIPDNSIGIDGVTREEVNKWCIKLRCMHGESWGVAAVIVHPANKSRSAADNYLRGIRAYHYARRWPEHHCRYKKWMHIAEKCGTVVRVVLKPRGALWMPKPPCKPTHPTVH